MDEVAARSLILPVEVTAGEAVDREGIEVDAIAPGSPAIRPSKRSRRREGVVREQRSPPWTVAAGQLDLREAHCRTWMGIVRLHCAIGQTPRARPSPSRIRAT